MADLKEMGGAGAEAAKVASEGDVSPSIGMVDSMPAIDISSLPTRVDPAETLARNVALWPLREGRA